MAMEGNKRDVRVTRDYALVKHHANLVFKFGLSFSRRNCPRIKGELEPVKQRRQLG